jgi:hypothetical protein
MAGDSVTAQRLCELYSDPHHTVHSHGGRTYGGVYFDIRGASYIVAVAEPEGCSLGSRDCQLHSVQIMCSGDALRAS